METGRNIGGTTEHWRNNGKISKITSAGIPRRTFEVIPKEIPDNMPERIPY